MRDRGQWILAVLAAAVATVSAIGYALIATDAVPSAGDLGTLEVPEDSGARAVFLSDGRPAFVVRSGDDIYVVDARQPLDAGTPGRMVLWCGGGFTDLVGSSYRADGRLLSGDVPGSLVAYPVTGGTEVEGAGEAVGRSVDRVGLAHAVSSPTTSVLLRPRRSRGLAAPETLMPYPSLVLSDAVDVALVVTAGGLSAH